MNKSENFLAAVGVVFVTMFTILIAVVGGTFFGAFAGWFVGLFYGASILGIAAQMGVKGVAMWQLGAFLGFVGSFFRSYVHKGKDQ